jgi:hypothetical protein
MNSQRMALFGDESLARQLMYLAENSSSTIIHNLTQAPLERRRMAFQSYHFAIYLYIDGDPDGIVGSEQLVREHEDSHGISAIFWVPVLIHYSGSAFVTTIQRMSCSMRSGSDALQLLQTVLGAHGRDQADYLQTSESTRLPYPYARDASLRGHALRLQPSNRSLANTNRAAGTSEPFKLSKQAVLDRWRVIVSLSRVSILLNRC